MSTISHILNQPDASFIHGGWRRSSSMVDVLSAHNERLYATVALADQAAMDEAIAAARVAFDEGCWPRMSPAERAFYLHEIAGEIDRRQEALGHAWTNQVGVPFRLSTLFNGVNSEMFRRAAAMAADFSFVEEHVPTMGFGTGLLVREPVGVVGAIVPWNAPLMLISIKVAPALLAGCTIVLKASPEAPIEAMIFAEICEKVGLPAGVVNVVTAGRDVSESLVRSPAVDKISFTGSSATGRRIATLCGDRIARYTLELGGKSAAVVLDDYDLTAVAAAMRQAILPMTGQACSLPSRVIVSKHRQRALVEEMAALFAEVRVGDPYDPATDMGPLATRQHLMRVRSYIESGRSQNATLAQGGGTPEHIDKGWFVQPTIFADVTPEMTIAQEEIFGPVIAVMPAEDEAHAVRLANDTVFGLNNTVFTHDVDRALAVARELRSGNVGHNDYWVDTNITFGGFKQSGYGREGGRDGLLAFLEAKTILLAGRPAMLSASDRAAA